MEVLLIKNQLKASNGKVFNPGEVYLTSRKMKEVFTNDLQKIAIETKNQKVKSFVNFIDLDKFIKKADVSETFRNLLIVRSGGFGDLIALSAIVELFRDCNIHFVTQKKYFGMFDWFLQPVKLYDMHDAFIKDFSMNTILTKYRTWRRFVAEGLVEKGSDRNWFEIFLENAGIDFSRFTGSLRPQLKKTRVNTNDSNLTRYFGKKKLLVCNKATAMMRTIHFKDIYSNLPEEIKKDWFVFVHAPNLSDDDLQFIEMQSNKPIILNSDFNTFLLDCYDADMLISVDTGALHFREGIEKPAIGLYNSFTTDSRTKYYKFTRSFDIHSTCEHQPCFLHETSTVRFCPMADKSSFAAPCFSPEFNPMLNKQLSKIFETI